jgi:sec-independent protein translocase protein TatA
MELLIILGIFLLLFGSAKLPGLARSMGQSIKEFKTGMRDAERADQEDYDKDKGHKAEA